MRAVHLTWTSVVTALFIGGCASRGSLEVLESALRQREDESRQLQSELEQARQELEVAQNEAKKLREQLAQNGQQTFSPEHLANEFRAVGLRFNTYLTSGIDRDGQPGDEQLSILLYPHDEDGGLVKLNGTLELRALDMTAPKDQQEISVWNYSLEETKEAWHSGFLAAGFLLEESWQKPVQGAEITLHARFKTADGRQFDAVQPLRIRPQVTQPIARKSARQKVSAAKPTILPASHSGPDRPEPIDPVAPEQPPEDREDVPGMGPGNSRSSIPTSDRYREWDSPRYR